MLAAQTAAVATACAAIAVEADAETGAADTLPFTVMSEPPPLLLRRLAERAGGRAPPVLVLEPPLAPVVERAAHPFACFAAEFLAAMGSEAMAPDG